MMRNILLAMLCIILQSATLVSAAQSKSESHLYLTGFDAASAGKYAYLVNSIRAMLVSRLYALDKVVIEDRMLSEDVLKKIQAGQDAGVEKEKGSARNSYLLRGEMFELAAGLNIQLALYPLENKKEIKRFSGIAGKPEELLVVVGNLVADMDRSLAGEKKSELVESGSGSADKANSGFITAHPEVAYKRSLYSGTIIDAPDSPLTVSSIGLKRTRDISGAMEAMGRGDLDGDGLPEILLLTGNRLKRVEVQDKDLEELETYTLPPGLRYHAINIADLNGDGVPEIYVSATDGIHLASLIMNWSAEDGFSLLNKNIRWYIRPVEIPGEGWRLAGQKKGSEKGVAVAGGVYLLSKDANGKLTRGKQLPLPPGVNLFDFLYIDLNADKANELAVIDRQQKLRVYSSSNELLWVSRKNYGGSQIYLGPSQGGATDEQSRTGLSVDEDADRSLIFVPPNLCAADLDGDGGAEIIVSENELSTLGFFHRLRMYDGGAVVGLTWKGTELREVWRTGNYKGFVAGYGFDLLKKASENEVTGRLYVASLPSAGSLMAFLPGSGDTRLTVYDLGFEAKKSIVK